METKDLETYFKDTKNLLKDNKFIAFSGVDRTTLDKKAFTKALKSVSSTCSGIKVAITYPGTSAESVYIYTKYAHAWITVSPFGESKRKNRKLSVIIVADGETAVFKNPGIPNLMEMGYFHINSKTQFDFEIALLKIRSILVAADVVASAVEGLKDTIDAVTETDLHKGE